MNKQTFKTLPEAQAFYNTIEDKASFCSVASCKDGSYMVTWEVEEVSEIQFNGKKLTVTVDGQVASRSTKNNYSAVVVGTNKVTGKLQIVSAHYEEQAAKDSINKHKAGQFVNFNYRECENFKVIK